MQLFLTEIITSYLRWIILFFFFFAFCIAFFSLNKFHWCFLKQTQLSRSTSNNFKLVPKKSPELFFSSMESLTQFFIHALISPSIASNLAVVNYFQSKLIFKNLGKQKEGYHACLTEWHWLKGFYKKFFFSNSNMDNKSTFLKRSILPHGGPSFFNLIIKSLHISVFIKSKVYLGFRIISEELMKSQSKLNSFLYFNI